MILNCVGEFTVFCNLIPNKVTQQILLSRLDTAALFSSSFCLKKAAQTGHNKKMFPLQTVFCWSNPTLFFYTCIHFSLLHPLPLLSSLPLFFSPLIADNVESHIFFFLVFELWLQNIYWRHFDNFWTAFLGSFTNSPLCLNWLHKSSGEEKHYRRVSSQHFWI